jgi:hypothetical protein
MRVVFKVLMFAALLCAAGWPAKAQDQHHVVSLDQLNKDAAQPAETRRANEKAIRSLLSSDAGQAALKSTKVDYEKVDKAISQLSDEDTAKLAERSRQAQQDFAAGRLSNTELLLIVIAVLVIVIIIVAV